MRMPLKKGQITHALVLPDIHYPVEDRAAMKAVEHYMGARVWDALVYLGDVLDENCVSSYNAAKPRLKAGQTLAKDFAYVNQRLQHHIELVGGSCRAFWLQGNHDERVERMIDADPALEGLLDVETNIGPVKSGRIKYIKYWTTGEVLDIGRATFIHGRYTNEFHAKRNVINYGANVFYGHCLSSDTEILTDRGWLSRGPVAYANACGSINSLNLACWNAGIIYYAPAKAFVENSERSLVRIRTRNNDVLVTPEHKLIDAATGVKYAAKEFCEKSVRSFACCGVAKNQDLPLSDDEIRLVIWITADGSIENPNFSAFSVRWHLKKQRKIDRLCELLSRLGITFTRSVQKRGTTKVYCNLNDWTGKNLFNKHSKHLPPVLRGCSARQTGIVLEEYISTDGNKQRGDNSYQVSTSKESEADILQEMFILAGYRCNKTARLRDSTGHNTNYTLAINTRPRPLEIRTNLEKRSSLVLTSQKGDGNNWCVVSDNGTLVTRRSGKVTVMGNCHDVSSYSKSWTVGKAIVGQSLGCLCDLKQKYMHGQPCRWVQAFGEFFFFPDGRFTYYVPMIFDGRFIGPDGKVYGKS